MVHHILCVCWKTKGEFIGQLKENNSSQITLNNEKRLFIFHSIFEEMFEQILDDFNETNYFDM